MIQLKPKIENGFICPNCGSCFPEIKDVRIQSMHVMADCSCGECSAQFFQLFPVGHHIEDQLSFSKLNGRFYKLANTDSWLFDAFVRARGGIRKNQVTIEKIIFKDHRDVVILNALDSLYGHVLSKLYNALYHLDNNKNLGLILIIPRKFRWLIPKGCAEAWVVDLELDELAYHYESIESFISREFERFESVYVSKAYAHPDLSYQDISRLTGIMPFDLGTFNKRRPVITFILREDRWWFPSVADEWFFRFCRELKLLRWGSRVLNMRQNQLVKRTIREIRKRLPSVDFYITGLGRPGSFKDYATDERKVSIDDTVEIAWCKIYAMSHVVVGIQGSNMLLPTALGAGCVQILPEDYYAKIVQGITVRYHDRRQLFFYRFVDQYSSPAVVSQKVVSMINHYERFYRNFCRNLYSY